MTAETTPPEPTGSLAPVSVSMIAEFRNAMATIRAGSEILIRGGICDPQIHRIACNLRAASVRMQELLDASFDGSRLVVGGPELVNVREPCDCRSRNYRVSRLTSR